MPIFCNKGHYNNNYCLCDFLLAKMPFKHICFLCFKLENESLHFDKHSITLDIVIKFSCLTVSLIYHCFLDSPWYIPSVYVYFEYKQQWQPSWTIGCCCSEYEVVLTVKELRIQRLEQKHPSWDDQEDFRKESYPRKSSECRKEDEEAQRHVIPSKAHTLFMMFWIEWEGEEWQADERAPLTSSYIPCSLFYC